jgi:hypothetical protein
MSNNTFSPQGQTFALAVTTASQAFTPTLSSVPSSVAPLEVVVDYRFSNVGTQAVWIQTALAGATAPTAVIPVAGTPQTGILINAGETRTFAFAYGTQFAVIAGATGSTLYGCIGNGNNT